MLDLFQGATIKRIMEETDTKITVSSINEINAFNVERVITIKGESAESMSKAEAEISAKLRAAYEGDVMAPQMAMFPGHVHPAMMGMGGYVAAAPSNFPQAAALQQQRGGGGGSVGQHQMHQRSKQPTWQPITVTETGQLRLPGTLRVSRVPWRL